MHMQLGDLAVNEATAWDSDFTVGNLRTAALTVTSFFPYKQYDVTHIQKSPDAEAPGFEFQQGGNAHKGQSSVRVRRYTSLAGTPEIDRGIAVFQGQRTVVGTIRQDHIGNQPPVGLRDTFQNRFRSTVERMDAKPYLGAIRHLGPRPGLRYEAQPLFLGALGVSLEGFRGVDPINTDCLNGAEVGSGQIYRDRITICDMQDRAVQFPPYVDRRRSPIGRHGGPEDDCHPSKRRERQN
jgi:hypothetical protein